MVTAVVDIIQVQPAVRIQQHPGLGRCRSSKHTTVFRFQYLPISVFRSEIKADRIYIVAILIQCQNVLETRSTFTELNEQFCFIGTQSEGAEPLKLI